MAKIYDEKEIEDLERQATLKQRQDAAMKILAPEKPDRVAAMREHEAQRRADWHKSNMNARARRLEGMVATEAGRYNPQQQAAALKWLEGNGYGQEGERRRQFDVTNETERIKAREKAAADREISRNKDGWWDDQGNFHPGASVRAAEAGGTWRLEQQRLKNEGAETVQDKKNEGAATVQDKKKEIAEIVEDKKGQRSTQRNQTLENIANTQANANVEAARERQRKIDERRAYQNDFAKQRAFETFDMKARGSILNSPLTPEERKEYLEIKNVEDRKVWWENHFGRGDQNQQEQQLPKVEGYTPERVAELIKRGYKVVDGKFVK